MNKKIIFFLPIFISSFLSSCNSNEQTKDYHIVDFSYNHENNDSIFISVVVNNDGVLSLPNNEPNIEDYVFDGWYEDKECQNQYLRFGLSIDKDFTLYAKWIAFEDAPLETKINKFQNQLDKIGKDANKVIKEEKATVGYPGAVSGSEGIFGVHDKYIYNRYKDITVQDYYQISEDNTESYYGQQQYYYDDNYFYSIYHDFEDDSYNTFDKSNLDETKINRFLSIDYLNLYRATEDEILNYYDNPDYANNFIYEFNGNYTKLINAKETYTYQEAYRVATYSSSLNDYVSEQYNYEYGITIENGKIRAAIVTFTYIYAIGEDDVQYFVQSESTLDFYYNNGLYSEYNGTKFTV